MKLCPCGYLGDKQGDCHCSADAVRRYRARVSGPLLDRIDIKLLVQRPPIASLRPVASDSEASADIAARVTAARRRQVDRAGCVNATLDGAGLVSSLETAAGCVGLLEEAALKLSLSARAYQRIQRVARTIADLAGEASIRKPHMAEAIGLWRPGFGAG